MNEYEIPMPEKSERERKTRVEGVNANWIEQTIMSTWAKTDRSVKKQN